MLSAVACVVFLTLAVGTIILAYKMGKNPSLLSPEATRKLVIGGIASGIVLGLANSASHFCPNWTSKLRRFRVSTK